MGIAVGVPGILVAITLSVTVADRRPLLPFVFVVAPVLAGVWVDWNRLWQPTRAVSRASLALWIVGPVAAITCGLFFDVASAIGVALALFAVAAVLPAMPMALGRLGWRPWSGVVREDGAHRLLLDTADGVLELERGSELGERREVSLAVGSCVSVLARAAEASSADPYRRERRAGVRHVLGAAASPFALHAAMRKRARAWTAYLGALALLCAALGGAAAYTRAPDKDPSTKLGA
jgi:hypothetical protein